MQWEFCETTVDRKSYEAKQFWHSFMPHWLSNIERQATEWLPWVTIGAVDWTKSRRHSWGSFRHSNRHYRQNDVFNHAAQPVRNARTDAKKFECGALWRPSVGNVRADACTGWIIMTTSIYMCRVRVLSVRLEISDLTQVNCGSSRDSAVHTSSTISGDFHLNKLSRKLSDLSYTCAIPNIEEPQ